MTSVLVPRAKRLIVRAGATLDTIWREAGRVRWGGNYEFKSWG